MKHPLLTAILCLLVSAIANTQEYPHFYVREVRLTTVNDQERQKMLRALQVFEQVMNDKEFQKTLLDTTYLFDLPNDPMRNLSPRQIVDTLFSGKEWYRNSVDHAADVIWVCNKRKHKPLFGSAIGYGYPSDSTINTYRFYVRNQSIENITANLAHEWSHKVGFGHQFDNHPGRDGTVPYLFGYVVGIFAKRYVTGN